LIVIFSATKLLSNILAPTSELLNEKSAQEELNGIYIVHHTYW